MKNLYLFFQICIVPLKIIPPGLNALCQSFFQSSKHAEKSSLGIAFNARADSRWISSMDSKRFPRSGLLSFGNSQKSHGAKSGEYGGCGATWLEFLAKNSRRTSAVCEGALSWCKIQELLAHNSGLFLRIASRKCHITLK